MLRVRLEGRALHAVSPLAAALVERHHVGLHAQHARASHHACIASRRRHTPSRARPASASMRFASMLFASMRLASMRFASMRFASMLFGGPHLHAHHEVHRPLLPLPLTCTPTMKSIERRSHRMAIAAEGSARTPPAPWMPLSRSSSSRPRTVAHRLPPPRPLASLRSSAAHAFLSLRRLPSSFLLARAMKPPSASLACSRLGGAGQG